MKTDNTTKNTVLYSQNSSKISDLEKEYLERYGSEFVEDLKSAYLWMRKDMLDQPPVEEIVSRRRNRYHTIGERKTVFYVDLPNELFYSVTIDEFGDKTISNWGLSPSLRAYNDNRNVRYLLSGMFFFDRNKTKKWLEEILGPGEKAWSEKA